LAQKLQTQRYANSDVPEQQMCYEVKMNTDQLMTLAVNKNGFIFDPENGVSYTVNETGLFILQKLQAGLDKDKITALLPLEYEVELDGARSDVEHFMAMLKALSLVQD
jgi:hypothetical protein